jgi:hypothetical protein
MLRNFTTTPSLPFKQQQNIPQSHFFPHHQRLGKKVGQVKIDTAKFPVNEILKIWKELDQTKRMQPTRMFSDHPFKSYSSLKMTCLKRNVKTADFFVTCDFRFLIS